MNFVRKWGGLCDAKNLGPQIRAILDNGIEGGDVDRLKDLVLRQLAENAKKDVGKIKSGEQIFVIYEGSGVRAVYDPTREWQYSVEEIMGIDEPMVTTQAILNWLLNGFKWSCAHIEDVVQASFETMQPTV